MKKSIFSLIMVIFGAITLFAQEPKDSDTVWVKEIGSDVKTVRFSPDGNYIYAIVAGYPPLKLSTATGEILMEYKGLTLIGANPKSNMTISPDGRFIYSANEGNTLYIWNTETGALVDSVQTNYEEKEKPYYKTITASDKYIAALVSYQYIDTKKGELKNTTATHIWDIKTHEKITSLQYSDIRQIKFSPDGRYLAQVSANSIIMVNVGTWDIYTKEFKGHTSYIQDIAFSPDGSLLASCGWGGEIKIWDIEKQMLKDTIQDYGGINSIAFAGDKYLIFQGSENYNPFKTKIWDIKKKIIVKEILTYPPKDIDVFEKNNIYYIVESIGNYSILFLKFDPNIVSVNSESNEDLILSLYYRDSKIIINSNREVNASLEIYNINSEIIYTNPFLTLNLGVNEVIWDKNLFPAGTYFCKITSDTFSKTYKIMVMK